MITQTQQNNLLTSFHIHHLLLLCSSALTWKINYGHKVTHFISNKPSITTKQLNYCAKYVTCITTQYHKRLSYHCDALGQLKCCQLCIYNTNRSRVRWSSTFSNWHSFVHASLQLLHKAHELHQWVTTTWFLLHLIIIIIITEMIFMVLSSWQSHCENSPASFDECRPSAGWPPTLRPSQSTWIVSPPDMAATIHIHHRHLLLLSPKADTHFTVPRRVEGWVNPVLVHLLQTHRSSS